MTNPQFTNHTLIIDNAPNIRFTGVLIGSASTSDDRCMSDFSGSTGRWTELALYQTKSGRYVCHEIECTRWAGEHDAYRGAVFDTINGVLDFFGHTKLADELYSDAGIDAAVDVD